MSEGLKPGDILTYELKLGTMLIERISPEGISILRWSNGDNKMTINTLSGRSGFVELTQVLAETHNCRFKNTFESEEKLSFTLVAPKVLSDHN